VSERGKVADGVGVRIERIVRERVVVVTPLGQIRSACRHHQKMRRGEERRETKRKI
jgi:hypothetical protein